MMEIQKEMVFGLRMAHSEFLGLFCWLVGYLLCPRRIPSLVTPRCDFNRLFTTWKTKDRSQKSKGAPVSLDHSDGGAHLP